MSSENLDHIPVSWEEMQKAYMDMDLGHPRITEKTPNTADATRGEGRWSRVAKVLARPGTKFGLLGDNGEVDREFEVATVEGLHVTLNDKDGNNVITSLDAEGFISVSRRYVREHSKQEIAFAGITLAIGGLVAWQARDNKK